ncbi:hypothetical protein [Paenibacillus terrae]|uniref:hypothetical protein n=2 Tax=Paenibacillus TaxID=44249 RepID=UPI0011EB08AC|nr:hypothetical protein [Paenibacillus terrae]
MIEDELENKVSNLILTVIPALKVKNIILHHEFNKILNCLDQLSEILKGKQVISKSLAYKLFRLYTTVETELVYVKEGEEPGDLLPQLYMRIMAVLGELFMDYKV